MVNKVCNECNEEKHVDSFSADPRSKNGRRSKCKQCRNKQRPKVQRKYFLAKKFNITEEEYEVLLEKQNGVCAICGNKEESSTKQYLAVDHCHQTGRIRGLLCNKCNVGVGALGDSIEGLEAALNYLKGIPSW
jgi:hypothetical protein